MVSMQGHAQIPVLVLVGNAHGVWSKSYWSERLLLTSVGFGSGPWKNASMKRMHLLWPQFSKVFERAHRVSACALSCWHTRGYFYQSFVFYIAPWMAIKNLHCVQLWLRFFSLGEQESWGLVPKVCRALGICSLEGKSMKSLVFLARGCPDWFSRSLAGVVNRRFCF